MRLTTVSEVTNRLPFQFILMKERKPMLAELRAATTNHGRASGSPEFGEMLIRPNPAEPQGFFRRSVLSVQGVRRGLQTARVGEDSPWGTFDGNAPNQRSDWTALTMWKRVAICPPLCLKDRLADRPGKSPSASPSITTRQIPRRGPTLLGGGSSSKMREPVLAGSGCPSPVR